MIKLRTITEGFLIPWGFSLFQTTVGMRGLDPDKKYFVFCIRLPLVWKQYDFLSGSEVFGSLVLRVMFFKRFQFIWIPIYDFGDEYV